MAITQSVGHQHGNIHIGQIYKHGNDAHKGATAKGLTFLKRARKYRRTVAATGGKSPSAHNATQVVERKQLVAISLAAWYCNLGHYVLNSPEFVTH